MGKLKNLSYNIFGSLIALKGNAKANILVQPLFSIPNNLYTTYATLYMLALGLTTTEIGVVNSVNMAAQLVLALVSFYVVDRFGRKPMSIVGDFVGWLVPVFIWATAHDMNAFLIAAVVNGFIRINVPAYSCIITEGYSDTERYHIFSWMQLANLVGWFFVPLGGYFVAVLGLVPAERAMYWTAFISYLAMFIIRLFAIKETEMGKKKKREMKGIGFLRSLKGYVPGLKAIFNDKALITVMFMKGLSFMAYTFKNTYLGVIATRRLGFADSDVSVFMTVNAIVMMLVLFLVMPFFNRRRSRAPIVIGYSLDIAGVVLMLLAPANNYLFVILAVVLMSAGYAMDNPCAEALFANRAPGEHRSVAIMISGVAYLIMSTPMSYLVGMLADVDDTLPFVTAAVIYAASLALYMLLRRQLKKSAPAN